MTVLSHVPDPAPAPDAPREYRYYDLVMVAFVTVLICSEFMAAGKIAHLGGFKWFTSAVQHTPPGIASILATVGKFNFGAGVIFFPLSYLFGDILTEVYGYRRSRKVIWAGFSALIFSTFMVWVIVELPPAGGWPNQSAWETVFGNSWRIVAASLVAYIIGEWANSVVLAKMKVWTSGKHLWSRTIGSTIVGEAVDSVIFYPLAFLGIWENALVVEVMCVNYFLKVGTEVVLTPLTYKVVAFLKRAENEDYYDIGTKFNILPGKD